MSQQLYRKDLTHEEVQSAMIDFFENDRSGKIVKIVYLLKNFPEYTKNILREVYGNFKDFSNPKELLYNIYYPNCKKICDVCKLPLDGFHPRNGYYQGFKHKMCRKPCAFEKFDNYQQLFNCDRFKNGASITFLSKRDDIIYLLDLFKKDFPQFNHYLNKDLVYILVMSKSPESFNNFPNCICGKFCRPESYWPDYNQIYFAKNCYDKECRSKIMVKTLRDSISEKYHVDNISKLKSIKEKKANTILKHYGNWQNFMDASLWGWCKSIGIENASQLQSVKDKKEANVLALGYSSQSEYLKKLIDDWCLKEGVTNVSQLDWVKQKKDANYLIKTNGKYRNPFQDPEVIAKIQKYWENHPEELRAAQIKCGENQKLHKAKIDHIRKGYTGVVEFDVLNELESAINTKIYRQVSCMQYFIDGYIKECNISIEYDEIEEHSKESQILHDNIRQKEIEDYCQCLFVRISEIDWKENKQQCINNLISVINNRRNYQNDKINLEELPNGAYRIRKVLT